MLLIYSDGGVVSYLWFVVLLFCLVQVWTEIAEHATLADLLEMVSSNREYLGKVVTVVMVVAERASSRAESLRQQIASFYSFGG